MYYETKIPNQFLLSAPSDAITKILITRALSVWLYFVRSTHDQFIYSMEK